MDTVEEHRLSLGLGELCISYSLLTLPSPGVARNKAR